MPIEATKLYDSQIITNTFERGCNFSATEEAVFAVMAPSICTMRNMAKTTKSLIEDNTITDNPNTENTTDMEDRLSHIAEVIKDCIPCNERINWDEVLTGKNAILQMIDFYTQYFMNAIEQIKAMGDMLSGKNQYVDLCKFVNFFKEYICVPDLRRLIAALSAFLMMLGVELSSLFDFILQLIGPIMVPLLNIMIDQFNKFMLSAIKPLECIIAALQTQISKLDYGSIFKAQVNGTVNTNPVAAAQAKADHENILQAERELQQAQLVLQNIDYNNAEAVTAARREKNIAQENYQKALRKKDLTIMGSANAALTNTLNTVRSSLLNLAKYLQVVIDTFNGLQNKILGDFLAMLNKLMGGGAGMIAQLNNKLAVVQLLKIMKELLKLYKKGLKCDTTNVVPVIQTGSDALIYLDDNGNTVIEENNPRFQETIQSAINGIQGNSADRNPQGIDSNNVNAATENDIRKKLNSIINYTGDKILDSTISKTVESITSPFKVKIKCSAKVTVADAEQVNKWISDLSNI